MFSKNCRADFGLEEFSLDLNNPLYKLIYAEKYPPDITEFDRGRSNLISMPNEDVNEIDGTFDNADYHYLEVEQLLKSDTKQITEESVDKEIFDTIENIGLALYDFFDVALIRALVDLAFDGLSPTQRRLPQSRTDLMPKKNEGLRSFVTFTVGGILGKQDCMNRALCHFGNLFTDIKGKALGFMVLHSTIPESWKRARAAFDVFEKGTEPGSNCFIYKCVDQRGSGT